MKNIKQQYEKLELQLKNFQDLKRQSLHILSKDNEYYKIMSSESQRYTDFNSNNQSILEAERKVRISLSLLISQVEGSLK